MTNTSTLKNLIPSKRMVAKQKRDQLIREFCFGCTNELDMASKVMVLARSPNRREREDFDQMFMWAQHFRYRYVYINNFMEMLVNGVIGGSLTSEQFETFKCLDFTKDEYWFNYQHDLFQDIVPSETGRFTPSLRFRNDAKSGAVDRGDPPLSISINFVKDKKQGSLPGQFEYRMGISASYPCTMGVSMRNVQEEGEHGHFVYPPESVNGYDYISTSYNSEEENLTFSVTAYFREHSCVSSWSKTVLGTEDEGTLFEYHHVNAVKNLT